MDQVSNSQGTWGTVKQAIKQSYSLLRTYPILILFALLVSGSTGFQSVITKHNFLQQGFTPLMTIALIGAGFFFFLHYLFIALVYKLAHDRLSANNVGIRERLKDLLTHKSFVLILFTVLSLLTILLYNIPEFLFLRLGVLFSSIVGLFIGLGMPIVVLSDAVSISGFFKQTWSLFKVSFVPIIVLFLLGVVFILGLMAGLMIVFFIPVFLVGLVFPPLAKFAPGFKSFIAGFKDPIMKFIENPQINVLTIIVGIFYVLILLLIFLPALTFLGLWYPVLLTIQYRRYLEKQG